jgi:Sulphur transport
MEIVVASLAFTVAALCALAMGYAIQRGATCTVAAVNEMVQVRKAHRLVAMLEASVWVAGGLLLAQAAGALPALPPGHALGTFTVLGGALLGLGAFWNRACVFGAVARFGSGEWAYAATPLGFYAGCLSMQHANLVAPATLDEPSALVAAAPLLVMPAALFIAARIVFALRASRTGPAWWRQVTARVWSPHAATIVIGVTFCVMLTVVGAWAYTDVLAELAHGMTRSTGARIALLTALLAGATLGGYTAGRFRATRVTIGQFVRCVFGGYLMGIGSLLIPGGNDGLILVGLPSLWPYAWLAFFTMCVTIAVALGIERFCGRHNAAFVAFLVPPPARGDTSATTRESRVRVAHMPRPIAQTEPNGDVQPNLNDRSIPS